MRRRVISMAALALAVVLAPIACSGQQTAGSDSLASNGSSGVGTSTAEPSAPTLSAYVTSIGRISPLGTPAGAQGASWTVAQPAVKSNLPRTETSSPAHGRDILAGTDCQVFPTDSVWHSDISGLPVNKHNAAWLRAMNASGRALHPDFGPGGGDSPYGIPITIAPKGSARVPVTFDYDDESDEVKYPLSSKTKIEGGKQSGGDRHTIVVTADTCELFETWDTHQTGSKWTAGSGAHWRLDSNKLRPAGWTSADAAGLPILPGLLRWSEVQAGSVNHAIRFTTNRTAAASVWPARHQAGSGSTATRPPMGARFRLKAGFDIGRYSSQAQVVLKAMQTYGLILADNGSQWFFQGDADPGWPGSLISELKKIPASAFEAVDASSLMVSPNSGRAATTPSCHPFPDVYGSNVHCKNIEWLSGQGITKPADGKYHPTDPVTRGSMAAFLFRLTHPGKSSPKCTSKPFPDVSTSNVFCGYIQWAANNGVAKGYPDGTFRPGNGVTRGAMAAFLQRIANPGYPAKACTTKPFQDVTTTEMFCAQITWLVDNGITYGVGSGKNYGTTQIVNRQSMASFLHRIDKLIA